MNTYSISLIILLWASLSVNAQTGNITHTIATQNPELNGDSLSIYTYIPASYNPAQNTPAIIGLHGLGDPENSEQIRQYLSPLADSLNALLLCPNPYLQDQPRTTAALNEALDFIEQTYTIDQNNLYLTGYSAGSDAAAQYAFSQPKHPVKALIWHSPGFFATPDMNQQASFPAICLLCGTTDFVSLLQANILNATFEGSSVPFLYNEIPGVGHTMNYPELTQELMECINFFNNGSSSIASPTGKTALTLYPNPASNEITVVVGSSSKQSIVTIFNTQGQLVISSVVEKQNNSLDIRKLSPGLYYLTLDNGKQQHNSKFIKQ
jgi:predicted esterase